MPNKLIQIGGEERPVAFNMNFHREFEKVTGLSFLNLKDSDKLSSYTAIVGIAYAALKWGKWNGEAQEPSWKFSLIQVAAWLDESPDAKKDIMDAMTEAIVGNSPKNVSAAENAA